MALFPIYVNGLGGFIDQSGEIVIPPRFESVSSFSDGLAKVTTTDDKDAFIDLTGEIAIPPGPPAGHQPKPDEWAWAFGSFSEGLAKFWVNDACGYGGYIDTSGKCVIPAKFNEVNKFSEGLAGVALPADGMPPEEYSWDCGATGFIDKDGQFVIDPTDYHAGIYGFSEGLCPANFYLEDGERRLTWTEIENCREGFINREGEFAIAPIYSSTKSFVNGFAKVTRAVGDEYKAGLVDHSGDHPIPVEFDAVSGFSDGRVYARRGADHFLFDSEGNSIARPQLPKASHINVEPFSEGLAAVSVEGFGRSLWKLKRREDRGGFMDYDGNLELPLEFDSVQSFKNGLALVSRGKTTGYIDRSGAYVWETEGWDC